MRCFLCLIIGVMFLNPSICAANENTTPEKAVLEFFAALKEGDIDAMLGFYSEEAKEILSPHLLDFDSESRKRLIAEMSSKEIRIKSVEIDDDRAVVRISLMKNNKHEDDALHLRLINGKWKLD